MAANLNETDVVWHCECILWKCHEQHTLIAKYRFIHSKQHVAYCCCTEKGNENLNLPSHPSHSIAPRMGEK